MTDRHGKGNGARWALLVVAALTAHACGAPGEGAPAEGQPEAGFVRVINVETLTLTPRPFVEDIRLTSAVQANRDVAVSAEEAGVITRIFVERGNVVRAGDPIVKIDDRVLRAQVDQARAAAELAAQTWERRRRLWEEDRVGSEIAYLEARYAAEQSAANLEALEARLARTVVRAPFAGVLDDRFVELGSMVSPGQAVARLVDLDPIKVVAGVPERYVPDVHVGSEATLTFDVLPGMTFRAPVHYVGSTVDPATRTFTVEVLVPNPDQLIKPEMVANMALVRAELDSAIVVPQDALVRVEDGYVVFVAADWADGPVAEVRRVKVGPARRNEVVIESGLEAGDRLIVVGHKSVADGDRIRIVRERAVELPAERNDSTGTPGGDDA